MPLSKLKNLALLILLLANLCLLGILIPDRMAARQEAADLRQSVSDLCAAAEVRLDPNLVPDTVSLYALELGEDSQADRQTVVALLGEGVSVQDDSTRYLSSYHAENGQCSMGRDGSFRAQLENQPFSRDLSASARRTLQAMGFDCWTLAGPERLRAGVFTVRAGQSVLGVPLFSQGLTLTYSNNSLTAVEGEFYPVGASLTRISDAACISAADALVAFLSVRLELGWMGSAITGMTQGYLRSETASAATVHLTPVWLLQTDTGNFYVNGLTREVSAAD